MLRIADNLSLPLEAITDTFAILAIRGAGKSHTASVMAEEMLKAGQPIVAYDPTGAWWGLKSSADGKRPGFPVVVFGGEHADVPLEESAGETIASTIIEQRIPAILDCSLMRKAARVRFMTDFAETLYHRNREPLHLFLDEAHTVAPQNIRAMPEASRLLGAIEDIILQGRRRGLGLTAISPRPAVVNANVRSACQTLVAMRVGSGKLDRKAIEEWVEAHGDAETAREMMQSLAGLPTGDAWVWNPPAKIFKRVHFRQRETFDSSATPKVGGRVVTPKRMAEIDLDALGEKIKATIEKAKADDPRELRKQIAARDKRIKELESRPESKPAAPAKVIEKPVIRDQDFKALHKVVDNLAVVVVSIREQVEAITDPVRTLEAAVAMAHKAANAEMYQPKGKPDVLPLRFREPKAQPSTTQYATKNYVASNGHASLGNSGKRRILIALAQHLGNSGVTKTKLSILTGISQGGGTWRTYLGELRGCGYVEDVGGNLRITSAGLAALGDHDPLPTGDALVAYWRQRLGESGKRRLFDAVVAAYPRALTPDELAERSGIDRGGGTWRTYLGELRGLELIEGRGELRAAACLFD